MPRCTLPFHSSDLAPTRVLFLRPPEVATCPHASWAGRNLHYAIDARVYSRSRNSHSWHTPCRDSVIAGQNIAIPLGFWVTPLFHIGYRYLRLPRASPPYAQWLLQTKKRSYSEAAHQRGRSVSRGQLFTNDSASFLKLMGGGISSSRHHANRNRY